MKNKLLMLAGLMTVAANMNGQTKKTTFYPNGNKEFEGEYRLAYGVNDVRDLYNFDTATEGRKVANIRMRTRGMDRNPNANVNVQKVYNGKCTFYYDNGKVSYTGNYANGVKDGLFSYSYYKGGKEAEYKYTNGMADGKCTSWHQNGKTRTELSYVALSETELDSLYKGKLLSSGPFMGNPFLQEHSRLRSFAYDSLKKSPDNTFSKFAELENSFATNSHWDGDFNSYFENGNKCTEMHYKNDVRTGKWHYYNEAGKENVVLSFVDGKIASVTNNLPADQPGMARMAADMPDRTAMMRPEFRDSMRNVVMQRDRAMGMQRPMPSVDVNNYIKENLKYPEKAKEQKLQGVVVVKFDVNEDGTTGDYEIVKNLCAECDEEAKRLIKSMPPWKPAAREGKPVKMSNTVPVMFNLKDGKK